MTVQWSSSKLFSFAVLICVVAGCGVQAPYMRGWDPVEDIPNRWTNGTIKADGLTEDERGLFEEFGTPDTLRFFRTVETREPVYEWIYTEPFRAVWFVSGTRVDYVTVDANLSRRTTADRENLARKLRTGGLLAGAIAGMAMGTVALIAE
jgi:hypothetical protein